MNPEYIHVISPYFGGSTRYFAHFWENLPTKISEFPSISYTSLYLEFQASLQKFENFLLCLIILPNWTGKSPYLSFQIYHMYGNKKNKKVDKKNPTPTSEIITGPCPTASQIQ